VKDTALPAPVRSIGRSIDFNRSSESHYDADSYLINVEINSRFQTNMRNAYLIPVEKLVQNKKQ